MCTTLGHADSSGNIYHGRTLELDFEEGYAVTYIPVGTKFVSNAQRSTPAAFEAKYPFLSIGAPVRLPTPDNPIGPSDFKTLEGLNLAGVAFSMLAYPTVAGVEHAKATTKALIDAIDVGTWVVASFASVDEFKAALDEQEISLTRLSEFGDLPLPFHMLVRDNTGKSVVLEWHQGELTVHDNPVGTMTNGPSFDWHLTNVANYTHLTNVDVSSAKFGDLEVRQPDSGIATFAIPGSNTSVGRFIKALYYTTFTEKAKDPDLAMYHLARIMDNFDRPRGVTVDSEHSMFPGTDMDPAAPPTEYTSWTNLSDLSRGTLLVRAYTAFNYTAFDLKALSAKNEVCGVLLSTLNPMGGDGTDAMKPLQAG